MMVSTTRHPLKFWFLLIVWTSLCLGLGTFMIQECIELYQAGKITRKEGFLGLSGLFFLAVAVSLPHSYWKNSPKITVDELSIQFGKQTFYLKDIDHFDLTAKVPFRYIVTVPMEGSTITFRDGTAMTIIDDMYANSWEVKSFLNRTLENVIYLQQPISKAEKVVVDSEPKDIFQGNQFIDISGIALWGGIGGFTVAYLNGDYHDSVAMLLTLLSILAIWFFVYSWFMNYFCLTKNFLLVRNHNLVWRKKYYRFTDIEEVVIEMPNKHPYSMRIITKDFRSKLYPASNLSIRTWRDLIDKLKGEGISVRNECISRKD